MLLRVQILVTRRSQLVRMFAPECTRQSPNAAPTPLGETGMTGTQVIRPLHGILDAFVAIRGEMVYDLVQRATLDRSDGRRI